MNSYYQIALSATVDKIGSEVIEPIVALELPSVYGSFFITDDTEDEPTLCFTGEAPVIYSDSKEFEPTEYVGHRPPHRPH